jgi:hypothetical protein
MLKDFASSGFRTEQLSTKPPVLHEIGLYFL